MINYWYKLSIITLQKSTDGKNTNESNITSRYSYKEEVLSLQSLCYRRIHPGSVTIDSFISTKKLTITTNYICGTKGLWYEQSMVRIVYGTNNQWYERSLGRMVHGTNGLHVVRIVRGTNSQWYEKFRYRFIHLIPQFHNSFSSSAAHH